MPAFNPISMLIYLASFALPVVTIYLLYRVMKNTERNGSSSSPSSVRKQSSAGILQERFAKGEISEEEYRERMRVLMEEDLDERTFSGF